jgi:hypothetical protein
MLSSVRLLLVFDFEESVRLEFQRVIIELVIAMENGDRNPQCTTFGEEIVFSTRAEHTVLQT